MNFNEEYKKIRKIADYELDLIEKKMIEPISISEPLNSRIREFLTSPSKRVRPFITILYLKSFELPICDNHLELLSAVELVHNASLIHDDIIDESDLRRGKKTVYSEFDSKLAVVSGDYILSVAMEKIALVRRFEILEKFSLTLKKMCIGEITQNFDKFKITTIEEYIEKSKNKTAYLFETALLTCAMLYDFSLDYKKMSDFALNLGIAFQIRDDLINILDKDCQKPSNNDIKSGIYTAPVIFAQSAENYSAGIEKTRDLLNNYIRRAKEQIEYLPVNKYSSALKKFLESLSNV